MSNNLKKRRSIGKFLSIARRAHAKLLDKELRELHLSHAQISLLMALYRYEGIYQQELCRMFNINKAAVAREIKHLQNHGYIIKKKDPEDKRKRLIYLTEKAKNNKTRILNIMDKVEARVRSNLTENEVDQFLHLIKKICVNLNAKWITREN
ncbi:MAG: MarR family transcriptional regulator [Candidatus Marinimicrobia bacterium]|nr:MarR family transcriptional regulator [Candidatus Neomarinimicrobiota bacterium]